MHQQMLSNGTLRRCLRWAAVAVALLGTAPPLSNAADKFVIPLVVNGITYQGEGVLADDGSIVVTIRIVYRQSVPGPLPPKPPEPEPKPVPTPSKITTIYLIHESGDGTPAFTSIRNASAWKAEADKAGIRWLVVDKDTAKAKLPEAVKKALAVGLPAIVLLDAQGLGVAEKCPATPDAMLARVKAAANTKN